MNGESTRALMSLAQDCGIQTAYTSAAGERVQAQPESVRAVLKLFGISARTPKEIAAAQATKERDACVQGLDPVSVSWGREPAVVPLTLPGTVLPTALEISLQAENGSTQRITCRDAGLRITQRLRCGRTTYVQRQLRLPPLVPGYYDLRILQGGNQWHSFVIAAPRVSFSREKFLHRKERTWGVFVPMYALHSGRSWGAGDFFDWQRLGQWVGRLGGGVVSTLPLLAGFLQPKACEASPYSPASRLFWNELYLHIPALPEFARSPQAQWRYQSAAFQRLLSAARHERSIDYPHLVAARRRILEPLATHFFSHGDSLEFMRFVRQRPRVEDYARFRAAHEQAGRPWSQWRPAARRGALRGSDYAQGAYRYHLYVQWRAQEQVNHLLEGLRAAGTQLYLDLPLGVHPDSYDVWRHQDLFAGNASVGAPPDPFFTKGQDWGFPPLHPEALRRGRYQYFLEYLEFQMRHAGYLRLDHVMGLHRLYWVPRGFPASAGVYVRYPAEELYAILCLESHRHHTTIVGENLGTVPPEVNAEMARHRLRSMHVVQYEQRAGAKPVLPTPPAASVASLNTHDMPTWAAHWAGRDLGLRQRLGLLTAAQVRVERQRRRQLRLELADFLKQHGYLAGPPNAAGLLLGCLRFLGHSPAEVVLVTIEDLWGEMQPQNVPGTSSECANWRRKTRLKLEQILRAPSVQRLLRELNRRRHAGLEWRLLRRRLPGRRI